MNHESRCARCETPLEASDLRCAICALPTPAKGSEQPPRAVEILRCDGCGAAVRYDVAAQAPRCAFCGDVMHIERPDDPLEEAQAYLPFRVAPGDAQTALRTWLGRRGFFCPSDLATRATVESLKPLWFVGWVFACDALVSWTADSDWGSGRSAWAPHAGQSPLRLDQVLVSASRGLGNDEVTSLAPFFDLSTAGPLPHAMQGATVERFDVQRSAARVTVARAVEGAAARHAYAWVPGRRKRNLHTAVLIRSLATHRLAFPSYVLAYRYRDRRYRVVVHGQRAECVLGDAPLSVGKILGVTLGVVAAIGLVVLVISLLE